MRQTKGDLGGDGEGDIVRFLRQEAERIARFTTRAVTADLPIAGTGTRRRLRLIYQEQLQELARHLELFGEEGPQLYGESQRRYAAKRLSQGLSLRDTVEERALLHDAILEVWSLRHGSLPPGIARLISAAFAETSGQIGDVFVTHQRAESAAFQEAALLETIVNHLDEAILVIERDGLVSYATPVLEQVLGYPSSLFAGVYLERLQPLLERLNFRDKTGASIAPEALSFFQALRRGEPHYDEELRVTSADGSEVVLEAYTVPVFDEDGELRGAIATLRDRTASARQTAALEAAIQERGQMHAKLLARTRLEAVGTIAGSAAHALNNQLNVITLRLRRLHDVAGAEEEAAAIERSVREIASLVSRLQQLAAAPRETIVAPMDVARVITEAVALVQPDLDGGQIDLSPRIEEPGLAMGDEETFLALLTSLLSGLKDVSPIGGRIEINAWREEGDVFVEIDDHAPPLGDDELEQLFEPLAGGAEARTLSLAAGRETVRRWGGELSATLHPEAGNRFLVRLAAAEAEEQVGEKAPSPARPQPLEVERTAPLPAARRVLVVDDDPDNADMLADLVEGADAEAVKAGTGEEAIEIAARLRPDAALVDLLLPDMKGWEVVRRLKERDPKVRIAVVSGLSVSRRDRQAKEADEVFRKPIDSDDVLHFLGL